MNKIIAFFFILSLPILPVELQEETFQFENLRIIKKPSSTPRSPISSDFLCEKASLIQSIELGNSTGIPAETALFLNCPSTSEELIKFYESIFMARDWRILQKDSKANKSVILGENPSKKVMTIIVRDEKDYRVVKIFYRRPGF